MMNTHSGVSSLSNSFVGVFMPKIPATMAPTLMEAEAPAMRISNVRSRLRA